MYVTEMAEWLDTKSSVKFGRSRSQLEVSCVSSRTKELWYNETVYMWMSIYIHMQSSMRVCVCYKRKL